MQNRVNYSDADCNDTSTTGHLQNSLHLVLFLIKKDYFFGAKGQIEIKFYTYYFCIAVFSWHGKYRLCQVLIRLCFQLI